MEEDKTTMTLPTAIIPKTIPELEGGVEQLLAAPIIKGKKVAKTATLSVSLYSTPLQQIRHIHKCYLSRSNEKL
eukprot:12322798-Ditylum_brightwellii.AAC.1